MILNFTQGEERTMKRAGILVRNGEDYSIDQSLDLMEQLRLAETSFAKKKRNSSYTTDQAQRFAEMAEKVAALIPPAEDA